MSSSIGVMIPNIWKNKNVPNHQPVYCIISHNFCHLVDTPHIHLRHRTNKLTIFWLIYHLVMIFTQFITRLFCFFWSSPLNKRTNGGFLKWSYPQIIHGFSMIFHSKPSILEYHHLWNPPNEPCFNHGEHRFLLAAPIHLWMIISQQFHRVVREHLGWLC